MLWLCKWNKNFRMLFWVCLVVCIFLTWCSNWNISSFKRPLSLVLWISEELNEFKCTLLFFIGLFVVVGGLEQTGVLEVIADFIAEVSDGSAYILIAIIIWISSIASAFIDNIPFSATMIPVIKALPHQSALLPMSLVLPLPPVLVTQSAGASIARRLHQQPLLYLPSPCWWFSFVISDADGNVDHAPNWDTGFYLWQS